MAWSFQDIWWFGETQSTSVGNVQIIYTYPDLIKVNEPFEVGVTLQYIKDKFALSNWIAFSNVTVHLRSPDSPTGPSKAISESHNSGVIRPGELYSDSFTVTPTESKDKKYIVILSLTSFFGPGGGALSTYEWDAGDWYNKNKSEDGGGSISPDALRSINVVNETQAGKKEQLLLIELQKPYGQMQDANIIVNKTPYNNTNMTNGKLCLATEGSISIEAKNCNMLSHSPNNNHVVMVPESIHIAEGIKGTFVSWSDGIKGTLEPKNNSFSRNVDFNNNNNIELYALYKTQYYLALNNTLGMNSNAFGQSITGGSNWYDGNSEAHFWVDSLAGLFTFDWADLFRSRFFNTFDRWEGDFSGQTASGSIIMDGPKTITAKWKVDWAAVGAVLGALGAAASIYVAIHEFRDKKR